MYKFQTFVCEGCKKVIEIDVCKTDWEATKKELKRNEWVIVDNEIDAPPLYYCNIYCLSDSLADWMMVAYKKMKEGESPKS